jgi:FKBP-type peptidyl-prolyl cis-trans isomerase
MQALFPFSLKSPYGPPMAFKLGQRSLVPGFEEGLVGMKVSCLNPSQA